MSEPDPKFPVTVDRRTFLKRAGVVGAGAVVASRLARLHSQDATSPIPQRGGTL